MNCASDVAVMVTPCLSPFESEQEATVSELRVSVVEVRLLAAAAMNTAPPRPVEEWQLVKEEEASSKESFVFSPSTPQIAAPFPLVSEMLDTTNVASLRVVPVDIEMSECGVKVVAPSPAGVIETVVSVRVPAVSDTIRQLSGLSSPVRVRENVTCFISAVKLAPEKVNKELSSTLRFPTCLSGIDAELSLMNLKVVSSPPTVTPAVSAECVPERR